MKSLKDLCDHVEANRVHPDNRPMLANNINQRNAELILQRWR